RRSSAAPTTRRVGAQRGAECSKAPAARPRCVWASAAAARLATRGHLLALLLPWRRVKKQLIGAHEVRFAFINGTKLSRTAHASYWGFRLCAMPVLRKGGGHRPARSLCCGRQAGPPTSARSRLRGQQLPS